MIETSTETVPVPKQIAALERMTVGQLQKRYAEVFGEPARLGNKQWLFRRVAWRIQALAEGDLATRAIERSRALARDLARDADLRLRPPPVPPPTLRPGAVANTDPTLMPVGTGLPAPRPLLPRSMHRLRADQP